MRIVKLAEQTDTENKAFFISELRRVGLVATQPRVKIFTIFHSAKDSKLTVFDIYSILQKKQSKVALSTIYKTLHHLSEAGILISRNFQDSIKFYELNRGQNPCYVVCSECGDHQEFFNSQLMEMCKTQSEKTGFAAEKVTLSINSICKNCLS